MKSTPSTTCNLIGYSSQLTPEWTRGRCNLIGYIARTSRLAAALTAAAGAWLAAAAHAESCCKPAPAPKAEEKSCCAKPEEPAPKSAGKSGCAEDAPSSGEKPCCAAKEIESQKSKIESPAAAAADFTRASLYQADGSFTDDSGQPFRLAQLRGRPVVVNLFFASCGYACPLTVTDLAGLQARLSPALRQDAVFVLVSFDLGRDTVDVLAKYREARQLDGNWILLRGDDASVRELAALLGVKYKQEADGSFAHSNLFTVLNREGEIVHQRPGLQGGLDAARAALERLQ